MSMKVYFFYRMIKGLEPALSAFTKDEEKAKLFNLIRSGYYLKEKKCTEDEYNEFYDTHRDFAIDLHAFRTSTGFRKYSVILPVTGYEIKEIILHKDDLVLRELQRFVVLPIELFTESLRKALHELGWDTANKFSEVTRNDYGRVDMENEHLKDFEVDELGLFLCLHKDSFDDSKIQRIYEK